MYITAMLTSLPLDFAAAVAVVERLGFTHVDVAALTHRPPEHREALAQTGLLVSCAAVGRDLPAGCTLDAADLTARKQAVAEMQRHLTDAAQLGATHAYLLPGLDSTPAGLLRLADACGILASYAAQRQIQLCIEHFPGRALPSVAATLRWLEHYRLDSLQLLLDVGHCLISDEDPAQAIVQAGSRLGYLHFDDNDSVGDLHWPLLTGRLTQDMLDAVFAVLRLGNYRGGLALEFHPDNAAPIEALRAGKAILEKCQNSS
jgi:sugar phosphate isomerase/epimerase